MPAVEQFSLWLPDADALLYQASSQLEGLKRFESLLSEQLPACRRLIRWAVIRVEQNCLLCEGAYLTQSF